eukprot:CAMPEP_0198679010 /NCGR_PEP_ID=MMETSP1468-20131203/1940_1 /TAXON_ID=1461545 /ORGANISM="Mantoniella sp, Strain CCMP1436" /LENGTH=42 /DNA_ID= /DNA_START= /DNA_END= /DNA_ORIENTATION=
MAGSRGSEEIAEARVRRALGARGQGNDGGRRECDDCSGVGRK